MRILGFFTFLRFDLLLQQRRGLYVIYLVLAGFYVAILRHIPGDFRGFALVLVLFLDVSILGFFFLGALNHWERDEKIPDGLFVTPCSPGDFLLVRTSSLLILTSLVSSFITLFSIGIPPAPFAFFCGLLLGALFFILLGFPFANRTHGILSYFLLASVVSMPLHMPLLDFFGILESPWFYLLPTGAMLKLLTIGVGAETSVPVLKYVMILFLWCGAMLMFSLRDFGRMSALSGVGRLRGNWREDAA